MIENYDSHYRNKRPQKHSAGLSPIEIFCCIVFILALIISGVQKRSNEKKEAQRKEIERQEAVERSKVWHMEYQAFKEKEEARKKAEYEEFCKEVEMRSQAIKEAKEKQAANIVYDYRQGYHDGYECGYDDGDCNEGYGYSFLDENTLSRYGSEYRQGFLSGYKKGYSAGKEDYQYTEGI